MQRTTCYIIGTYDQSNYDVQTVTDNQTIPKRKGKKPGDNQDNHHIPSTYTLIYHSPSLFDKEMD